MNHFASLAIRLSVTVSVLLPSASWSNEGTKKPSSGLVVSGILPDTPILKGERTPFEGVLVSYPQYYYYNEQLELNFEHVKEHKDCAGPALPFLGGFTLAILAAIAISAGQ